VLSGLKSRRARQIAFLVVGVTTPIGVLAVNGAAFLMAHLAEFRVLIAVCALVSSLFLNGLTAWLALRLASRRAPDIYREYRRWLIGLAAIIVVVSSVFAAYLTYLGMQDPRHLPNRIAVVTAGVLLLVPVAFYYTDLYLERRKVEAEIQALERRESPSRRRRALRG
jgi:4-amino-4-deoxy-L-arabinose transferase-like glycosyltransferase